MLLFPALELFLLQPPTVEELTLETYVLTSHLKVATSRFGGFGAVTNDTFLVTADLFLNCSSRKQLQQEIGSDR